MWNTINNVLVAIDDFVWGVPLMVLIMAGGLWLTVRLGLLQVIRLPLALRWMVMFSRKRGEKTMEDKLAGEILDAYNNTGASVKRKEDMHKMAEANKAFSHYRF